MNKPVLVAILAGTMALASVQAKDSDEKSGGDSPAIATINGEPVSKADWSAIMKTDQWLGPTLKSEPGYAEKMQGKPFEDFFFTEEVVKVRVLAQRYKDALPSMKSAIEDLLKRAKAGEDFASLAKQYSQDQGSAMSGGDIGRTELHQMVFPFNRIALSLKEGEISDPVLTVFGYHILKVEKVFPAAPSEGKGKSVQVQHILIRYPGGGPAEAESLAKEAKIEVLDKGLCKKLVTYCH